MIDIFCNLLYNNILTLLLYTHGVLHFFLSKNYTRKSNISMHQALQVVQVIQNH